MSAEKSSFISVLRGLAEPSLVLFTGILLVGALSLPLMPVTSFAMPLRPVPDARTVDREQLARQIGELESVGRAEVLLVDGTSQLVLFGVMEIAVAAPEVDDLLAESGYQRDEFTGRTGGDVESVVAADPGFLISTLAIQALLLGGLGWAFGRRRLLLDTDAPKPFAWPRAVLFGLAAGGLVFVGNGLVSVAQGVLGFPAEEQDWIVELVRDPDTLLRLAPWVVLLVPISEELMFRFYAMRYIAHHAGIVTAALSSSLMFAVVHLNPSGFLAYTAIGLVLAWSYRRSGRILVPILAHVVHNGLALTVTYLFPDIV